MQKKEIIAFKVVQIKSLAMHITDKNLSFYIFTVGNLQNIFMEHDLYHPNDFWHKKIIDNFQLTALERQLRETQRLRCLLAAN